MVKIAQWQFAVIFILTWFIIACFYFIFAIKNWDKIRKIFGYSDPSFKEFAKRRFPLVIIELAIGLVIGLFFLLILSLMTW